MDDTWLDRTEQLYAAILGLAKFIGPKAELEVQGSILQERQRQNSLKQRAEALEPKSIDDYFGPTAIKPLWGWCACGDSRRPGYHTNESCGGPGKGILTKNLNPPVGPKKPTAWRWVYVGGGRSPIYDGEGPGYRLTEDAKAKGIKVIYYTEAQS